MPVDPDAPPEDRFRAYLAEQEDAGAFHRPKRKPRVVLNAVLLVISLAIWGLLGWILARNVFG